jgi:hypothetical protein
MLHTGKKTRGNMKKIGSGLVKRLGACIVPLAIILFSAM